MASSRESYEEGYDVNRFETPVRPELLCGICHDVPKDPRLCHKDHLFCLAHISQHLQTTPSCPVCIIHLTPETLRCPTGFLKHFLEDMKINCNYNDRGCPDYVRLENLQSHVDQCGFAAMICTNEGCEMEINRRDQDIHERNHCQFSIAKCHDCSDIKESQEQSKARLDDMKVKLNETKVHIADIETKQDQIKETVDELKHTQAEVKVNQNEIKRKQDQIDNKINQMTAQVKASQEEMKVELQKTKVQITGVERKQDQLDAKMNQMTANVGEIKQTQPEMKAGQVALKAEMRQQFEKMTEMMSQILQGTNNNNLGDPAVAVPSAVNQDIIILGGWYAPDDKVLNTVETFNIVEGNSAQLPPMNHPRAASASCVYNNDVIMAGGYDGQAVTDTIEILKMNQHPLQWRIFDGKLPAKLSAHVSIVYEHKLILIGGLNWTEKRTADAIHELRLTPPYTSKLSVRMPQPRQHHGAQLVNGKLYILGGTTTGHTKDITDSVLVYDFLTNKCKPCTSLPRAVRGISTVTWGNMIIVVGGKYKNDEVLNDVIMYDTESERSENLPSMIHKRCGCSAVIMNDVIVVFGGFNDEQKYLNSIESFTMGSDGWKELPEMKEKRYSATAVVKPHN